RFETREPAKLAGGQIPDQHHAVVSADCDAILITGERHALELAAVVGRDGLDQLSIGGIPQARRVIGADRDDALAIWARDRGPDGCGMTFQRKQQLTAACVPDLRGSIAAGCHDVRTTAGELHVTQAAGMSLETGEQLAALNVPYVRDWIDKIDRRRERAVGAEGNALDTIVVRAGEHGDGI